MKLLLPLLLASATFAMEPSNHTPSLAGSSWIVTGLADAAAVAARREVEVLASSDKQHVCNRRA